MDQSSSQRGGSTCLSRRHDPAGSISVAPDADAINIKLPRSALAAATSGSVAAAPTFNLNLFANPDRSESTGISNPPSYASGKDTQQQDEFGLARSSSPPSEYSLPWKPPEKKGTSGYRWLRWGFGSVYRRIFCIGFLANTVALLFLAFRGVTGREVLNSEEAISAVSANLLSAMLVRNEHVINALFIVFGTWPRRLPLRFKRVFAKIYSYGGIHSGCGAAATAWFIAFVGLSSKHFVDTHEDSMHTERAYIRICTIFLSYTILCFLVTILVFAYPTMRIRYHNSFESTHRFLGWSIVGLFWILIMITAAGKVATSDSGLTMGMAVAEIPSFWMLICITLLVIYPWTRLKMREVEAHKLSNHALLLRFTYRNAHYGQAVRLTDSPLKETHAFATIPNPPVERFTDKSRALSHWGDFTPAGTPRTEEDKQLGLPSATPQDETDIPFAPAGKKGFSVVISSAGDWTQKMISRPPTHIYTRGVPQYGVLRVAGMFEPVIVVATGSGIAPCLSLFVEKPDHPVRIVWSTKNPIKTYGHAVVNAVKKADPDALIWDTGKKGRPDLVQMLLKIWEDSKRSGQRNEDMCEMEDGMAAGWGQGRKERIKRLKRNMPCEAVVIISNQRVTREVVYGMESRGIPAYGAIFDS